MKRPQPGQLLLYCYVYCWYFPLFIVLLGLKICLISTLMGSLQKGTRTSLNQTGAQLRFEPLKLQTQIIKRTTRPRSRQKNGQDRKRTNNKQSSQVVNDEALVDWHTLNDLENSIISPSSINRTDPSSLWLIYNQVPHCGGKDITKLLQRLAEINGFTHQEHEYRTPWQRFLIEQEQENLVTWFEYQHLPKSYNRHFFYVNFTTFEKYVKERPIYINMVQDPVSRLASAFYEKRDASATLNPKSPMVGPDNGQSWTRKSFHDCVKHEGDAECAYESGTEDYTMTVPFFCGQHRRCVLINDKWALQRAKFTIEKYYSVVGVLEKWKETLQALEKYIPRFFQNATSELLFQEGKGPMYRLQEVGNHRSIPLQSMETKINDKSIREILMKKLPAEFDLYNFINQRLSSQVVEPRGLDRILALKNLRLVRIRKNFVIGHCIAHTFATL